MPSTTDRSELDWPQWLLGLLVGAILLGEAVLSVDASTALLSLTGGTRTAVHLWLAVGAVAGVFLAVVAGAVVRPAYAVAGLLGAPLALLYGYSGLVLPWDQLSFWVAQVAVETLLAVPVAGEPLARLLVGGVTLSQATLDRAYLLHRTILWLLALATAACAGRLLWVRRDRLRAALGAGG